jgi:hypothetical protein
MSSIDNENQTLKQKLKKKFLEWCEQSTSHGIPSIARSTNWVMRIMWTLFFLGSLSYCSVLIIQSLVDFLKYETTISVTRVQELPATFPAVTICNINPFNEIFAEEYIQRKLKDAKCFKETNREAIEKCFNSTDTNDSIDTFVDQLKRILANDKNITEYDHYFYGYDLDEDMLISCKYNGIECFASDFTKYWSNQYGNCYTFNSGYNKSLPLQKTSEAGDRYGLALELVVSK